MLRNVIERFFAVLKKRFPILTFMQSYSIEIQSQIIMCCVLLNNFIRRDNYYENDMFHFPDDHVFDDAPVNANLDNHVDNDVELNDWRDGIAQEMWDDYLEILVARGMDVPI